MNINLQLSPQSARKTEFNAFHQPYQYMYQNRQSNTFVNDNSMINTKSNSPKINYILTPSHNKGAYKNQINNHTSYIEPQHHRRYSIGWAPFYHNQREALSARNNNYVNSTYISQDKWKKQNISNTCRSSRGKKIVGKNTLKPSSKPCTAQKHVNHIQPHPQLQLPSKIKPEIDVTKFNVPKRKYLQIGQSNDNANNCKRISNQRLMDLRMSQSIDPIVHPYRDRSTDSYHYFYGYPHSPADSTHQQVQQNGAQLKQDVSYDQSFIKEKYNFDTRPTACIQQNSHPHTDRLFSYLYGNNSLKPLDNAYYKKITNPQPKLEINLTNLTDAIKEEFENQKDSKEIQKNAETENQIKENAEIQKQENKKISNNKKRSEKQSRSQQNKRVFVFPTPKVSQSSIHGTNLKSKQQQSEAEKCKKIKYLYEPYSMSLSSNHKGQPAIDQLRGNNQISSPLTMLKGMQYLQNQKEEIPEEQNLYQRQRKHDAKLNNNQYQGEDKWDKILRIRQLEYQKASNINGQETQKSNYSFKIQDETALHTALKLPFSRTLEQMNNHSTHSYQSSGTKEKQRSNIEYSQGEHIQWSPQFIEGIPQQSLNVLPSQEMQGYSGSNTSSYRNFSKKIQDISRTLAPQIAPTVENEKNLMKYSYSFEEPKENPYKVDKELFHKFLNCKHIEWMLVYSYMAEYVEKQYFGCTDSPQTQNQPIEKEKLVTFVKIGDDGTEVFNNRVVSHFIGVWLIGMGFMDGTVKQRIIQNVELMFTDVEELIQEEKKFHQDNEDQQIKSQGSTGNDNIRQIAQLMYNNLLFGYLPSCLQMQALLETCKRGWEYFTFLICKILRILIKQNRKLMVINSRHELQFRNEDEGPVKLDRKMFEKLEEAVCGEENF